MKKNIGETPLGRSTILKTGALFAAATLIFIITLVVLITSNPKKSNTQVTPPVATTTKVEVLPPELPKLLGVHTVIPRDTLWWISDKWYHDPVLWPAIYEINKSQIKDPDLIYAGQLFDIPYLDRSGKEMSGNDATLLSQGYLEAYRVYKAKGKAHSEDYKTVGDGYAKK